MFDTCTWSPVTSNIYSISFHVSYPLNIAILLFIGAGILDASINYIETIFLNQQDDEYNKFMNELSQNSNDKKGKFKRVKQN